MSKYIIKNCPCYESEGTFYNCVNERIEGDCQDCTDCVMKQIVELCIHYKKNSNCNADCPSFRMFLSKLLSKLDIQEVE